MRTKSEGIPTRPVFLSSFYKEKYEKEVINVVWQSSTPASLYPRQTCKSRTPVKAWVSFLRSTRSHPPARFSKDCRGGVSHNPTRECISLTSGCRPPEASPPQVWVARDEQTTSQARSRTSAHSDRPSECLAPLPSLNSETCRSHTSDAFQSPARHAQFTVYPGTPSSFLTSETKHTSAHHSSETRRTSASRPSLLSDIYRDPLDADVTRASNDVESKSSDLSGNLDADTSRRGSVRGKNASDNTTDGASEFHGNVERGTTPSVSKEKRDRETCGEPPPPCVLKTASAGAPDPPCLPLRLADGNQRRQHGSSRPMFLSTFYKEKYRAEVIDAVQSVGDYASMNDASREGDKKNAGATADVSVSEDQRGVVEVGEAGSTEFEVEPEGGVLYAPLVARSPRRVRFMLHEESDNENSRNERGARDYTEDDEDVVPFAGVLELERLDAQVARTRARTTVGAASRTRDSFSAERIQSLRWVSLRSSCCFAVEGDY